MSEKRMNDELAAVEALLGSLTPAASSVDRDRLMFLAGRASVERLSPHPGPAAAWLRPRALAASLLAMTSVAAVLLVMLVAKSGLPVAKHGPGPSTMSIALPSTTANTRVGDFSRAALGRWRDDKHGVLTGADIALPDEFFSRGSSLANNDAIPAKYGETNERPLSSPEFMQRVLHGPKAASDPFYQAIF